VLRVEAAGAICAYVFATSSAPLASAGVSSAWIT
jgi:hypothetical protein